MRISLIAGCLLVFSVASAQKEITIDDFTSRDTFAQKTVSGINWMNDGRFYTSLKNNQVIKFNVTTGEQVEIIFDGKDEEIGSYSFSADEQKLLIATRVEPIYRRSTRAEFLVYDIASKTTSKLSAGGKQSYATFLWLV